MCRAHRSRSLHGASPPSLCLSESRGSRSGSVVCFGRRRDGGGAAGASAPRREPSSRLHPIPWPGRRPTAPSASQAAWPCDPVKGPRSCLRLGCRRYNPPPGLPPTRPRPPTWPHACRSPSSPPWHLRGARDHAFGDATRADYTAIAEDHSLLATSSTFTWSSGWLCESGVGAPNAQVG